MDGFEQDSPKPHTGDIRKPGEVDTGLRGFVNFLVISGMLPEINWLLGSPEQGLVKEQREGGQMCSFQTERPVVLPAFTCARYRWTRPSQHF